MPEQVISLRWPLQIAAASGSTELVLALISRGLGEDIDRFDNGSWTALMIASQENHHRIVEILLQNGAGVDRRNDNGFTALCIAADLGYHRVVRVLLQNGATVSSAGDNGFTALLLSAHLGHLVVADMLVRAGAELEARRDLGHTALHLAASDGYLSIVRLLVEAGANPDTHLPNGQGPLYSAAFHGHVDIVKLLLGLGVNPARPAVQTSGVTRVALDVAAQHGHRNIVRELLQLGIETCGGETLGMNAIVLSAHNQHVDVMAMLQEAGAADADGVALFTAATTGHEEVVRFLLQQEWAIPAGTYVNNHNSCGVTALCLSVEAASPRIARMLLDAGAEGTKASRLMYGRTTVELLTPLAYAVRVLADKQLHGKLATEDQLHRLEGIRRLLLQADAVRAASWLWCTNIPVIPQVVGGGRGKLARKASTSLGMLKTRRGSGVRRALLASFFR